MTPAETFAHVVRNNVNAIADPPIVDTEWNPDLEMTMPELRTYIEIGICKGYGDGDFRVRGTVRDLSDAMFNEMVLSALTAIEVARDMRRPKETAYAAKAPDPS